MQESCVGERSQLLDHHLLLPKLHFNRKLGREAESSDSDSNQAL